MVLKMIGSITHGVFFFNFIPSKETPCFRGGCLESAHMKIIPASRKISTVFAAAIWKIQKLRAFKKPSIDNRTPCRNSEDIVKKLKTN
jgi:hypothetical protein